MMTRITTETLTRTALCHTSTFHDIPLRRCSQAIKIASDTAPMIKTTFNISVDLHRTLSVLFGKGLGLIYGLPVQSAKNSNQKYYPKRDGQH